MWRKIKDRIHEKFIGFIFMLHFANAQTTIKWGVIITILSIIIRLIIWIV